VTLQQHSLLAMGGIYCGGVNGLADNTPERTTHRETRLSGGNMKSASRDSRMHCFGLCFVCQIWRERNSAQHRRPNFSR